MSSVEEETQSTIIIILSALNLSKILQHGNFITSWGSDITSDGQYLYLRDVAAVDSSDKVYIHSWEWKCAWKEGICLYSMFLTPMSCIIDSFLCSFSIKIKNICFYQSSYIFLLIFIIFIRHYFVICFDFVILNWYQYEPV